MPDCAAKGAPLETPVQDDHVFFLSGASSRLRLPFTPAPLRNHGNYVISLNRFVRWLADSGRSRRHRTCSTVSPAPRCCSTATEWWACAPATAASTGTARRDATFEPGVDVRARLTIFADGVRGNLTKQLLRRLPLAHGREPEQFAIGIKELWEVPEGRTVPGTVIHTLGWPLRMEEFGGGFVYTLPGRQVAVGLVVGLDYKDPLFDPHTAFQRFKQHPLVSDAPARADRW